MKFNSSLITKGIATFSLLISAAHANDVLYFQNTLPASITIQECPMAITLSSQVGLYESHIQSKLEEVVLGQSPSRPDFAFKTFGTWTDHSRLATHLVKIKSMTVECLKFPGGEFYIQTKASLTVLRKNNPPENPSTKNVGEIFDFNSHSQTATSLGDFEGFGEEPLVDDRKGDLVLEMLKKSIQESLTEAGKNIEYSLSKRNQWLDSPMGGLEEKTQEIGTIQFSTRPLSQIPMDLGLGEARGVFINLDVNSDVVLEELHRVLAAQKAFHPKFSGSIERMVVKKMTLRTRGDGVYLQLTIDQTPRAYPKNFLTNLENSGVRIGIAYKKIPETDYGHEVRGFLRRLIQSALENAYEVAHSGLGMTEEKE